MPVLLKPFGTIDWEQRKFGGVAEVRGIEPEAPTMSEEEIERALRDDVDVLIADIFVRVTGRAIEGAKKLRGIVCRSIGVDYLDVDAATRSGVVVTNIKDYCAVAVAEYAMGLILSVTRFISKAGAAVSSGDWNRRYEFLGVELSGKTAGIIGLGSIGKHVARLCDAFGMRVLAYSPRAPRGSADEVGARLTSLEELLYESDIVSLHTSLRDETRTLINERTLAMMKPGAYLVNVSRGGLVDEEALAGALASGRLAGAALDVLCVEPPLKTNPLVGMENVIVTPHIAWNTREAREKADSIVERQVLDVLAGKVPPYVVNPEVIPFWRLEPEGEALEASGARIAEGR